MPLPNHAPEICLCHSKTVSGACDFMGSVSWWQWLLEGKTLWSWLCIWARKKNCCLVNVVIALAVSLITHWCPNRDYVLRPTIFSTFSYPLYLLMWMTANHTSLEDHYSFQWWLCRARHGLNAPFHGTMSLMEPGHHIFLPFCKKISFCWMWCLRNGIRQFCLVDFACGELKHFQDIL